MPRTSASGLTHVQILRVALGAEVDPRTVRRYLGGASPRRRGAIERALRKIGAEHLVRKDASAEVAA